MSASRAYSEHVGAQRQAHPTSGPISHWYPMIAAIAARVGPLTSGLVTPRRPHHRRECSAQLGDERLEFHPLHALLADNDHGHAAWRARPGPAVRLSQPPSNAIAVDRAPELP